MYFQNLLNNEIISKKIGNQYVLLFKSENFENKTLLNREGLFNKDIALPTESKFCQL